MLPHPENSVVRLFARAGDHRVGDFARTPKEIEKFATSFKDHNIYVAPNPTTSVVGERHSAIDVTHWSYFLIDMDPVEETYDARAAIEDALRYFGEWQSVDFGLKKGTRPILIDSGRGMQAWIRLDDHPLYTAEARQNPTRGTWPLLERSLARRINGYWLKKLDEKLGVKYGCRIDTSVSDLPRVMRCPGTMNLKTGRMARFLNTSDYVFEGLAMRMSQIPEKFLTDPEPPVGVAAGQPWQMVFAHLTLAAQTYLQQGQEEPGRHKVMWHTARKLAELGVTRRETRKALKWANALKGEGEALPAEQIEHALDTAYPKS